MARLLRAEWMKMWGRPADRYVIAGLLSLAAVIPVVLTGLWLSDPGHQRAAPLYLKYPTSAGVGVSVVSAVATLLVSFLAGSAMGSEYADGTWKLILPRRARRGGLIVAKLVLALGAAAATAVLAVAALTAMGAVCTMVGLHEPVIRDGAGTLRTLALVPLATTLLRMLLVGAIAALVTILSRSSLIGLGAGIVIPQILEFITYDSIVRFMPMAHLSNFRLQLLNGDAPPSILRGLTDLHCGALTSALVVLAYVVAIGWATACVFERQELSS